jgi:hypothetical protein
MPGDSSDTLMGQLRHMAFPRNGGAFSDAALLAAYATHRDEVAFAALVKRHGVMVLNVCRQGCGRSRSRIR